MGSSSCRPTSTAPNGGSRSRAARSASGSARCGTSGQASVEALVAGARAKAGAFSDLFDLARRARRAGAQPPRAREPGRGGRVRRARRRARRAVRGARAACSSRPRRSTASARAGSRRCSATERTAASAVVAPPLPAVEPWTAARAQRAREGGARLLPLRASARAAARAARRRRDPRDRRRRCGSRTAPRFASPGSSASMRTSHDPRRQAHGARDARGPERPHRVHRVPRTCTRASRALLVPERSLVVVGADRGPRGSRHQAAASPRSERFEEARSRVSAGAPPRGARRGALGRRGSKGVDEVLSAHPGRMRASTCTS